MLTRAQDNKLKELQRKSSHQIQVVGDDGGAAESSTVVLKLGFPELYVYVDRDGKILRTETEAQREQG